MSVNLPALLINTLSPAIKFETLALVDINIPSSILAVRAVEAILLDTEASLIVNDVTVVFATVNCASTGETSMFALAAILLATPTFSLSTT